MKTVRTRLGFTQTQLAERIGVSFATVNRWENRQSKPNRLAWQRVVDLESELAVLRERTVPIAAAAEAGAIPLTRVDIADYVGLAPESVSRALRGLQREGIIELVGYQHFRISDHVKLKRLLAGEDAGSVFRQEVVI